MLVKVNYTVSVIVIIIQFVHIKISFDTSSSKLTVQTHSTQ